MSKNFFDKEIFRGGIHPQTPQKGKGLSKPFSIHPEVERELNSSIENSQQKAWGEKAKMEKVVIEERSISSGLDAIKEVEALQEAGFNFEIESVSQEYLPRRGITMNDGSTKYKVKVIKWREVEDLGGS